MNWTCEGLKPFFWGVWFTSHFLCELNLWGIETFSVKINLCSFDIVWIEPVRDWNGNWGELSFWGRMVWIEPVRDWNISAVAGSLPTCEVWIEPVRDWNRRWWTYFKSFNPVWIEPVRDWNGRNKPFPRTYTPCVNWTCEGLKPLNFFNKLRQWYQVWIEPVRDWNLKFR